jgi:predicted metal-dependent phosphoesterase TrpH
MPNSKLRLEFHCHTIYSRDCLLRIEKLLLTCEQRGIERIVITDHNTISGALQAKEIDPQRVIVGEEILTTKGELLAAFVKEEVPRGLSPFEAIASLREQGAFISVSHPFDQMRKGHWHEPDLEEIVPHVDAIEIFNSRCMSVDYNQQAEEFARRYRIPGTVGSDAHAPFEIGRAVMRLPQFEDATSLKAALPKAEYETKLSSPFVHFTSRYAVWYKSLFNPQLP